MTHLQRLVFGTVLVSGLASTSARAVEPDKLLPASTDTIAIVNVRQLLQSDIAKKYALEQIKQTLQGESLKETLTEFGLDPLKDLDQLIVATSGKNRDDLQIMFIIHGKFNPKKLFAAAESQARKDPDKVTKVDGGEAIMFKVVLDNIPPVFVTVVDENTVIAATDKKMVSLAMKASNGDEAPAIKKQMAALIRKIDGNAAIAVAGIVAGKLDELKLPGGNLPIDISAFQELIPKIETLSFSIQVRTDVTFEATLGMKDKESAGDFRAAFDELLKQLKPLAQLGGAVDPRFKPLSDVLTTFRSTSRNTDVTILGKVTGDNIGKMINPDQ